MRNNPSQGNVIMSGEGSFVNGEDLKKTDVPAETIYGGVIGGIQGALLSSAASLGYAFLEKKELRKTSGEQFIHNLTNKGHGKYIAAGAAGFAVLGGVMAYARSSNHNDWSDKYYALLEKQATGHADKLDASRATPPTLQR